MSLYLKEKKMENYLINPIIEPKDGIAFDLLLTNVDKSTLEIITCPICLNLVWNIVDCGHCGSLFCKYCIDQSISKANNSCPVCRHTPFQTTQSKTIRKIIDKYKLKCPNIPCDANPEYADYISHQEKCQFRKYHCKNEGCDFEASLIDKENLENHTKICQYKIITCQYCNKGLKEIDFVNHLNNECSKVVECDDCHQSMATFEFLSKHDAVNCLKNQLDYYKNKIKDEQSESYKNELDKMKTEIDTLKKENTELIEKNKILSNEKEKLKEEIHRLSLNKKRKRLKEEKK